MSLNSLEERDEQRWERSSRRHYLEILGEVSLLSRKRESTQNENDGDELEDDTLTGESLRQSIAERRQDVDDLWVLSPAQPEDEPSVNEESTRTQTPEIPSRRNLDVDVISSRIVDKYEADAALTMSKLDLSERPKSLMTRRPYIYNWNQIGHVDLIHRQGLNAPPLVFDRIEGLRPYYMVFLPLASATQSEMCLCGRRKQGKYKFRFSLDPNKLIKRGNPAYSGKLTCSFSTPDSDHFVVSSGNGMQLADIVVTSTLGKHSVRVEILNQYLNWYESGSGGRVMVGSIHTHMDPMLSLQVISSNRTVMQIRKHTDLAEVPISHGQQRSRNKLVVNLDYPLTVFLAFAIACAVDSHLKSRYL